MSLSFTARFCPVIRNTTKISSRAKTGQLIKESGTLLDQQLLKYIVARMRRVQSLYCCCYSTANHQSNAGVHFLHGNLESVEREKVYFRIFENHGNSQNMPLSVCCLRISDNVINETLLCNVDRCDNYSLLISSMC